MVETFAPSASSPVADLPSATGGVSLAERPDIGKVVLRASADDAKILLGAETALGVALPTAPNTVGVNDDITIFWLGPDEWLIYCPLAEVEALLKRLRQELEGQHVALTDVSDYYVVLRLTGSPVREVLSKGTPFDLHPSVFKPGDCAQTRFGHASILLHCVDSESTIDVQVRWSFAEYLWLYLVESASEYTAEDA